MRNVARLRQLIFVPFEDSRVVPGNRAFSKKYLRQRYKEHIAIARF